MTHANSNNETQTQNAEPKLFRHKLRPQWGLAVIAWEGEGKRGYQFEDGKLRVFKEGFFDRLEAVAPEGGGEATIEVLTQRLDWKQNASPTTKRRPIETISFGEQLSTFSDLYPKGFQGLLWSKDKRGIDTKRGLKRHRDQGVVQAQRLFAEGRLRALIDAGESAKIIESILELGRGTDLVTKKHLAPLGGVADEAAQELAESLLDLLHGSDSLAIRFERHVVTLARTTGQKPTWPLATLVLALFSPKEYLFIKPTVLKTQAATVSPHLKVTNVPSAPAFERLCELAATVREKLVTKDYRPRDLLDVLDFMSATLAPKVIKAVRSAKLHHPMAAA